MIWIKDKRERTTLTQPLEHLKFKRQDGWQPWHRCGKTEPLICCWLV
jgi:hypothetical protein